MRNLRKIVRLTCKLYFFLRPYHSIYNFIGPFPQIKQVRVMHPDNARPSS